MSGKAFQDYYPENLSHCYGCGRLNGEGHQIKSYWDGEETVCRYRPREYHMAVPGYVYGGLLASLIDCHATGTASAASTRAEGLSMASEAAHRYVTASLQVDYLRPTPIDAELTLRGIIEEIKGRKVIVNVTLSAAGEVCARGKVVAVRMPESMGA